MNQKAFEVTPTKPTAEPTPRFRGTELERARIHGPDTRTVDALEWTTQRAEAAERDFIQVHKNCMEAREKCDSLERQLARQTALLRRVFKHNTYIPGNLLQEIERELEVKSHG